MISSLLNTANLEPSNAQINQNLSEHLKTKCSEHKCVAARFCFNRECVSKNNGLLCVVCMKEHPREHEFISTHEAFSTLLIDELWERDQENQTIVKAKKIERKEILDYIDELYDQFQKDVTILLESNKNKVKKAITSDYSDCLDKLKTDLKNLQSKCFGVDGLGLKNYAESFPVFYESYRNFSIEYASKEIEAIKIDQEKMKTEFGRYFRDLKQDFQVFLDEVYDYTKITVEKDFSRIRRFASIGTGWQNSGANLDAVAFTVSKTVRIAGFGIYLPDSTAGIEGEVKFIEGDDPNTKSLITDIVSLKKDEFHGSQIYQFIFDHPVKVFTGKKYICYGKFKGGTSFKGNNGCNTTVEKEKGYIFNFYDVKGSNQTTVATGQIPEIYYVK